MSRQSYVRYIQYMLNEADKLGNDQADFVEAMGRLMAQFGAPLTAGRLYGYLLLAADPVSLDQMTAALEISKSGASTAARLLELYGLANRTGERGSRRVRYEAVSLHESPRLNLMPQLVELFRAGARVAPAGPAQLRLQHLAGFYAKVTAYIESLTGEGRALSPLPDDRRREGGAE